MPTRLGHHIQLAVGHVVSQPIPPVVREVQPPGGGVEVEPHGVAHACGAVQHERVLVHLPKIW